MLEVFLIFIGFVLLIKGADFLVDGSSNIAKKFHIPEMVIGLTIVSIGTSLPELFVSLSSALEGHSDMAIGNVIGSNLINLLFILGISSAIKAVRFKRITRIIDIPICIFVTAIFMVLCNIGNGISRVDSIILLVMFALFIAYTIFMAIKGKEYDKDVDRKENKGADSSSTIKDILFILLGIAGLKFGGDLTVNNAVTLAEAFNLSEKIISITILSIGTSLPELVTSISAAIKGKSDIAIGNILGSNIFNMLLIIGTSALVNPIVYNASYNMDMTILVFATIILALFPLTRPMNKMSRKNGALYLALYTVYMISSFLK